MARFNFTGETKFPKANAKRPFVKKSTNVNKQEMLSLNLGIKASNNNMAFITMNDSVRDVIKTKDLDNKDIQIKWEDRLDEDVISQVAYYKLFTVDLGEGYERKQFLTGYDCIQYLKDNLKDCKICVTGDMEKSWYNGEFYTNFKAKNFYVVDNDVKSKLLITADIYFNKDCVDKSEWAKNKVIYIDGYIQQYFNKDIGTKFVPERFVFNASKIDPNNEQHKKILDYKLQYVDIDKKTVQHLQYTCVYHNGAEEVEFSEDLLTKAQKQQIALGIKTIDDFKPKGNIFGDKVIEYRIIDPVLMNDFADGFVDTEMKMSEFEEEIFVPAADESINDVLHNSSKQSNLVDNIDDSDLFG